MHSFPPPTLHLKKGEKKSSVKKVKKEESRDKRGRWKSGEKARCLAVCRIWVSDLGPGCLDCQEPVLSMISLSLSLSFARSPVFLCFNSLSLALSCSCKLLSQPTRHQLKLKPCKVNRRQKTTVSETSRFLLKSLLMFSLIVVSALNFLIREHYVYQDKSFKIKEVGHDIKESISYYI